MRLNGEKELRQPRVYRDKLPRLAWDKLAISMIEAEYKV
jgi:hypothetical protein